MKKTCHRTVALLATVSGFALCLTGVARAAGAPTSHILATTLVNKTGTTITVTAEVGRGNTISVWQSGSSIRIRDTGDTVAPSGDCTAISTTEVACRAADTTELVVIAGDQDDNVTSSLAALGVTLIGGAGNDNLYGGPGNDTISGLAGNDTINGNAGNDTLNGDDGNDTLGGDQGNDTLTEGRGNDTHIGSEGNDTLNAVDNVIANDSLDGGLGFDTCNRDTGDTAINCP